MPSRPYLLRCEKLPPMQHTALHTANNNQTNKIATISRRKQSRHNFAMTQRNWFNHQRRWIKSILSRPDGTKMPGRDAMEGFGGGSWRRNASNLLVQIHRWARAGQDHLWFPVTTEEVTDELPDASSSPGPHNLNTMHLKDMWITNLTINYNIILFTGLCRSS